MSGVHNTGVTKITAASGNEFHVTGPFTQVTNCWPKGWAAVQYGWRFGFGFASGICAAACVIAGLSKLWVVLFA